MPAAANVPGKTEVGMAQKGPNAPQIPSAATATPHREMTGLTVAALIKRPAAPTTAEIATCHRRSPCRSEWRPIQTMPTAAIVYGNADENPTIKSLRPDRPLIICGSQKLMLYKATTNAK